ITEGDVGISLFSSWNNQLESNVLTTVDRGFYLFDAQTNQLQGNEVKSSIQSALLAQSANNVLGKNNFVDSQIAAEEDDANGSTNTWQGNYWESAPYSITDSSPATTAWPMGIFQVPNFQAVALPG